MTFESRNSSVRLIGNPLENAGPALKLSNLSTPSVIFGSRREIFGGNLWKSWGSLRQSSEVFRNLRQSSVAVGKSLEIQILWRRKISRILLSIPVPIGLCSYKNVLVMARGGNSHLQQQHLLTFTP